MAESRVTKAGVYLEISVLDPQVNVTKAGAYLEISLNQVRVTMAGVYLEIIEVVPTEFVHSTALGAYIELAESLAGPTNLTATAISASQIDLDWADRALIEDAYYVERSLNGTSGWVQIAALAANSIAYSDTGLWYANTTFYYRVRAGAGSSYSAYSNVASATTLGRIAPSTGAGGDNFAVALATMSGTDVPWPSGVTVTVQWYGSAAQGGNDQAEIFVNASEGEALWDMLRRLGYLVTIRNRDHTVVWQGLIEEVVLALGNVQVGLSLANMYNRVAVAYSTEDAGGTPIRATTAWAQDTESIDRYGYKELLFTMADASQTQAEAQRATLLAASSTPAPIVRLVRDERPGATLRCVGLFATLGWRYYDQPAGLEEHPTGGSDQPLGQGYTAATVGFTQDGRIHDTTDGRLPNLERGHNVQISGSSSNNGTALLDGTGQEGEAYTASTLEIDPSDDINDSVSGMALLNEFDVITISGTASNNGVRYVETTGAGHVTVNAPPDFTFEAAGSAVTLTQADSVQTTSTFTNELPSATVTLVVHGQKIAQSFSLEFDTSWTLDKAAIRLRKVGAAGDNVKVELCADSSGVPGTVLDSVTVAGSTISERMAWVAFDLANTQTLSYGTTYWLVVSRSGANDIDEYYVVDVDADLGYSRGTLKLWNGASWVARATDADLAFRLTGAWETTKQVEAIYDACGQFFEGLDIVDASGVYANQYRAGDATGLDEALALLDSGTGAGGRILATVTPERILRVRSQATEADLLLAQNGSLRNQAGQPLLVGLLPTGRWVRLADVPGNVDALAQLATFFVERSEFHAADEQLRLEAQGEISPWELGRLLPHELSRQAKGLKPYIVTWG